MKTPNDAYRIILADDHAVVRAGIRRLIEEDSSLLVVSECRTGNELIDALNEKQCDLVILDISMPEMDGLRTLEVLKQFHKKVNVIVLTMHRNAEYARRCINMGASGYILKDDVYEHLNRAIYDVRAGKKSFSPDVLTMAVEHWAESEEDPAQGSVQILTKREKAVLVLLARGLTSRKIGGELGIGVRTVESHRANIMNKLKIHTTAGLVKFAVGRNLI